MAGLSNPPVTSIKFTVGAPSQDALYRQLARAALDLDDGLSISDLRRYRERFGTEQLIPMHAGERAKLQFGPSDRDLGWELVLLDSQSSRLLCLTVSFRFSASVFPMLPKEYWWVRLRRCALDGTIDLSRNQFSMTFDPPDDHEPVDFRELCDSIELFQHLHEHNGRDVRLALERHGKQYFASGITFPTTFHTPTLQAFAGIQTLWKFAVSMGKAADKISLSLAQIGRLIPIAELMLAARAGETLSLLAQVNFSKTGFDPLQRMAIVSELRLDLAGETFIELVAVVGQPEVLKEDGEQVEIRVLTNQPRSMGRRRYRTNDLAGYDFMAAVAIAERELADEGIKDIVAVPWNQKTAVLPAAT